MNPSTSNLRSRLPADALDYLDLNDGKHSVWATACAVGMHALNAGFTEDEFVQLVSGSDFATEFCTEQSESGTGAVRVRMDRLENRLRKVWSRVDAAWSPPLGSVELVRQQLAELSQRVAEHPWVGVTGSSDLAAAEALIGWAYEVGVWTLDASTRDLALRAGLSHKAACGALRRLEKTGLVTKDTGRRKGVDAQRWVLNLRWGIKDMGSTHESFPPKTRSCVLRMSLLNHPAFHPKALGRSAGRVWVFLVEHPGSTAKQIHSRTGVNLRTVRRVLASTLRTHHLVKEAGSVPEPGSRKPSVIYEVDPAGSLELVAEEYGTAGWFDRASERVNSERAARAEKLKQWGELQAEERAERKAQVLEGRQMLAEAERAQARQVLEVPGDETADDPLWFTLFDSEVTSTWCGHDPFSDECDCPVAVEPFDLWEEFTTHHQ